MREGSEIRTKKNTWGAFLIALTAYAAVSALIRPARTAESVSAALSLSVRAVVPSLFAFVAAMKILSPTLAALFSKMKRLGRFFGVGAGGLSMMFSGLLSGFPTAAVVYSELYKIGAIDEDEGESLMPFCSGASAAFLIGAVGKTMFGDAALGVRLFICQTVAALILILITKKRRRPSPPASAERVTITPAIAARAVAEAGATMLGVSSFIAFFSVIADALAADLGLGGYADAIVRSALEISGGTAALSRVFGGRYLLGFAAGFSGFSVFMQSHYATRGAAMKKYVSGKLLMSVLTGALLNATELFRAVPTFFELFGSRAAEAKNTARFVLTLALMSAFCVLIGALVCRKAQKAKNK